jgi:hypothetical protein
MTVQIVALQLLVPLTLFALLALVRWRSRATCTLTAIVAAAYLLTVALAGVWLLLPWYLPILYAGLFFLALRRAIRLGDAAGWSGRPWRIRAAVPLALLALGTVALAARAVEGRMPPERTVDLAFPLRRGTYLVVNGGRNTFVSAHQKTRTLERFRAWRGQSDGVDLVRIDAFGRRARGWRPADPAAYYIFGDTVHAPCAGQVVTAVNGIPDQRPPITDRAHMAGNHVILACGGVWILLGHLQRGSVLVSGGDGVALGEPVGRVGNTGNSDEPHLHIHAQTPGARDAPFSGTPLPIRLDGRYLARNDRVSSHPPKAAASSDR